MNYKRVIIPIDFSDLSLKALEYGIDFAKAHRSELLLLHIIEPISHTRFISDVAELLEHQRADAADQLEKLENRTKRRWPRCKSEIHFGIPYVVISDTAKLFRADLIIMATHGFAGLHHLLVGSVAERVVRLASCPVLTIRPESKQAADPESRRSRL